MKKLLIISIALVLIFALVGCGQRNEEIAAPDTNTEDAAYVCNEMSNYEYVHGQQAYLMFSSLEEFLLSYMAVRNGMRAEGFIPTSFHGDFEHFSEMAESVDLLSLERLYLPVNIPEEYKIYSIDMCEHTVIIQFIPEKLLGSQNAFLDAITLSQYFQFSFTRDLNWGENPMSGIMEQHGVTEADLIDGKYLFRAPNRFRWAMDNELFGLRTPSPHIVGFSDAPEDMVQFTEVYILDLTDEDAIKAILGVGLYGAHAVSITNGGVGARANPANAAYGRTVTINAGASPDGYIFAGWTSTPAVTFADSNAAITTFVMPDEPVEISAMWEGS